MRQSYAAILAMVVAVGSVVWAFRNPQENRSAQDESPSSAASLQCGHWSILRCCEVLGVGISFEQTLDLLPWREQGQSLGDLAKALKTIGLVCRGRAETIETLATLPAPVIAHLKNPDHFIVVLSIDPKGDLIHTFDSLGQKTTTDLESFRNRWSGKVLCVARPKAETILPAYVEHAPATARAQFQRHFIDLGSISSNGSIAQFEYGFTNLGDAPLLISSVAPSCACVGSDFTQEPVRAGETGFVRLEYRPGHTGGPFLHEAIVKTNDPASPTIRLRASGFVSTTVRISPNELELGKVAPGEKVVRPCFLQFHNRERKLQVLSAESDLEGLSVSATNDLAAVRRAGVSLPCDDAASETEGVTAIVATYQAPPGIVGKAKGIIRVSTNIEGYEQVLVPVNVELLALAKVTPSLIVYGEIEPDGPVSATVVIHSTAGGSCRVLKVDHPDAKSLKWSTKQQGLGGGRGCELTVSMQAQDALKLSDQNLLISVEVDDMQTTVLRCPVFAMRRS